VSGVLRRVARASGPCVERSTGEPPGPPGRRGAVLIVILVCVALAVTIIVSVARSAVVQQQRVRTRAWQLQARLLAESALERAAARLAADPKYAGETWSVPPEALDGRDGAAVQIQVEDLPRASSRRLVRVRADFPDQPDTRVRHTRQAVVEIASRGDKS